MSPTQKAIVVAEVGKPVKLVDNWPISEPSANQIQIKVSVAGINPHDQKARDYGLLIGENLPAILTNDIVGTVTKLGQSVSGVAVGDRVFSQAGFAELYKQNGLQEYSVADVGTFAKVPEKMSDDEAATLPTSIMAPLVAIFVELGIPAPWTGQAFDYANTTLLIVGGGSSCGKYAVQLAKLAGIGRIVAVGGSEAELKGYGATHVVDRHGGHDAVLARVRAIVGDGLLHALDTVNGPDGQLLALNALSSSKKGALARLVPWGAIDESKVVGKTAGFDVRDVMGSAHIHTELSTGFWERLPGFLEAGKIKPMSYVAKEGLTAENVNEVLDAYRDGKSVVKTNIHL